MRTPHATAAVLAGLAAGAAAGIAPGPVRSDFVSDVEGWVISTRTLSSSFRSVNGVFTPDFIPADGDDHGYAEETDPDGNWSFFDAPPAFLGDRADAAGQELRFSVRTNTVEFDDGRLVILIGPGDAAVSTRIPTPTVDVWNRVRLNLSPDGWFAGTVGSGDPATKALFDTVLGDLNTLLIGMEYGSSVAEETVGIDRVLLGVCPADLAENLGSLDFFDVLEYLALFEAGDPAAELDGSPGLTFFDVLAYLDLFDAGCP